MHRSPIPYCFKGIDDCNKLIIACLPIQANWEELGTHLNVTRGSIQTVREDNSDSTKRLAALITIWLKRERREDHPSWRNLCEAMVHIDRALAEQIAGEHQCSHGDCRGMPHAHKVTNYVPVLIKLNLYKSIYIMYVNSNSVF